MDSTDFAEMADAMDQLMEITKGFRAKCEEAGFSPSAAEAMTVAFFMRMMEQPQ